jgi:hypothetical protein
MNQNQKRNPRIWSSLEPNLSKEFEELCNIENRNKADMVRILIEEAVNKAKLNGKIRSRENGDTE